LKSIKHILRQLGLLHDGDTKSERIALYILDVSFIIIIALIPLAVIDEFIFNRAFHEYLSIIGKLAFSGLGIGCILVILATNRII